LVRYTGRVSQSQGHSTKWKIAGPFADSRKAHPGSCKLSTEPPILRVRRKGGWRQRTHLRSRSRRKSQRPLQRRLPKSTGVGQLGVTHAEPIGRAQGGVRVRRTKETSSRATHEGTSGKRKTFSHLRDRKGDSGCQRWLRRGVGRNLQ